MAEVPDPRDRRGVRHALAAVLALSACAVLAGATSLLAVLLERGVPEVLGQMADRPADRLGDGIPDRRCRPAAAKRSEWRPRGRTRRPDPAVQPGR
ncbi:transposase family protein [Streptomyces sp. NPDC005322]|uniref:transposase family protein n=1 Tax=Streptomyces sp. NPDC005322 TaxID=3157032 RepID=UPI0033AB86F8